MKREDITAIFPDIKKEDLDKIMDLHGADLNASKTELASLRGQLAAAQAEVEKYKAKPGELDAAKELKAVKDELAGLRKANSLRDLREKVSKETGVPASLLTAEDEEGCKTQAEAIKAFSDSSKPATGYPHLRDGGEVHGTAGTANRDKFAEWFNKSMN